MSDYLSKEKCELNVYHTAFIATVAEIKKSFMHPIYNDMGTTDFMHIWDKI